jgi:hypothetical protein
MIAHELDQKYCLDFAIKTTLDQNVDETSLSSTTVQEE